MTHRYIRQADTGKSIDALLTATWLLAAWGSIGRWLERGEALLDANQQADLRMTLTSGKYDRHAVVLEPGGSGWGNTLRLECFTDDAFEKRLLTDRIDARQFHWRPAAEPRIDGVRAHLAGGAIIEATWSENGAGEALLVADNAGGSGSWGTQTDRRNGEPIAWPPREAVEAGVARAAEVARRRATDAAGRR